MLKTETEFTVEGPAKSILAPAQALLPVTVMPSAKPSLSNAKSSVPEAFISLHVKLTDSLCDSPVRLNGAGKLPPEFLNILKSSTKIPSPCKVPGASSSYLD